MGKGVLETVEKISPTIKASDGYLGALAIRKKPGDNSSSVWMVVIGSTSSSRNFVCIFDSSEHYPEVGTHYESIEKARWMREAESINLFGGHE